MIRVASLLLARVPMIRFRYGARTAEVQTPEVAIPPPSPQEPKRVKETVSSLLVWPTVENAMELPTHLRPRQISAEEMECIMCGGSGAA